MAYSGKNGSINSVYILKLFIEPEEDILRIFLPAMNLLQVDPSMKWTVIRKIYIVRYLSALFG